MSRTDHSSIQIADKELARAATLSSILYPVAWLIVSLTTEVADELPLTSLSGILLLGLIFVVRCILGLGFDSLYERLSWHGWQRAYGTTVLLNAATWGALNALLIWYYFPSWPAYLMSFCTAGLAAGGSTALYTHLRLSRAFGVLMLVPSLLTLVLISAADSAIFGTLYLIYLVFLLVIGRQLNQRYWESLRNARLLEEQVVQLQEARDQAEAGNRAKGQFLANMSHEIRTPLNAVMGFAQVGMRTCHDPDARDRFSFILASGRHLLGIINEILDLSKLDAGKLRIESAPFELVASVDDAVSLVKASAREKDLDLTVECDPELPVWVVGDPARLRQILVNLLGNAIKFTRQGRVGLVVHPDGSRTCFRVTDTGIGLDGAQIARIFTAFEQADGTTTRQFGGTGLGLAISRDLVELMGGTITVESEPGQGSTFQVCLPLTETQQPEEQRPEVVEAAGHCLSGITVMAVEDDRFNRMVLKDMLEYEGATVVLAHDGQQAIELLQQADPDVFNIVLMDVQMPVMDGYETTRRIHSLLPSLTVIGLTAHALPEERDRCLAAGMVSHITKPVNAEQLLDALLQQLPVTGRREDSAMPAMASRKSMPVDGESSHVQFPGFDIEYALENLKCDLPTFRKILLTFYRQRRDSGDEVASLLEQGHMQQAGDIAHSIKGSSGYLGAWRLHHGSAALEKACESGDRDSAMQQLAQFRLSLEEVIDGLKGLEGGSDSQSEAP
jgi:signal transduction histidine kinase/CheY-like chemotaxis protein/HPt (histidine-containing phosphotransfer) domain-containing protein